MDLHPYLVRRARLLLGEKKEEFGKRFGVDEVTVSRWEKGKACPSPKNWSWIRGSLSRSSNLLAEAVRASPTYKCVVSLDDLTSPTVISKGMEDALAKIGIERKDLTGPFLAILARSSRQYEISGIKALSMVQSNQSWIRGEVIYAEAHCYSPAFKTWLDCIMAPLPGEHAALIEAVPSSRGEKGGFWVRFVNDGDVSGSEAGPQIIH
jgi:hypothetical protein